MKLGANHCSLPLLLQRYATVRPLTLKIRGPETPVVAGEMVSLTCLVEGARPAASIDWFNRSELVDPQPLSMDEVASDGTFR